jgi:hypothetical protein
MYRLKEWKRLSVTGLKKEPKRPRERNDNVE